MLKSLRGSIMFPLCHIFNQSIYQGSFPDLMKRTEVILLYKGKEMDYMINYRPISLLITLSKLLEKVIYKRLYSFLELNKTLFSSKYGFRSRHSCKQAILEFGTSCCKYSVHTPVGMSPPMVASDKSHLTHAR